ncbi:phenoloxidase 1-like isoform X2 [Schistocerca gregaria]|uniref:phenoloxidase 1-like isoform X2 n=1 Tax=Schistocerca gregaria TaxID=7010 RepID=UPI00211E2932|nr:phenoloxidase 1-like isoform X2 [Schistocerca gregaria]
MNMANKYLLLIFILVSYNSVLEALRPKIKRQRQPNRYSVDKLRHFYCLLERLNEPVSVRKGINRTIVYKVPMEYLTDRFQGLELIDRSDLTVGVEEVDIKPITLPNISTAMELDWKATFSIFLPKHQKCAAQLMEIFLGLETIDDFTSASVYCRERINPNLYVYAVAVALFHRPDTQNWPPPSIAEIFPDKFLERGTFLKAREEANIAPAESRVPIEIPMDYTASNLEPEHHVAYFREDVGVGLVYWYWHMTYPQRGPPEVLRKDRSGELFYYFHQQIIARYDFERLSNNMGRVERLLHWDKPIEEAYFPKLDNILASRVWPSRLKDAKLQDINRETDGLMIDIQDLQRYQERIYEAIHQRAAVNENGELVPLTESNGIEILSHLVQSTGLSINEPYYGALNNDGHTVIAFIHDPDGRHLEQSGVMGGIATSVRDPIFYRWHKYIDDIFQEYKNLLPRYTEQQLDFPGITVTSVEVVSENAPRNEFATFWQKSDIDLYRGLDFTPRGPVLARVTHLQHSPFSYLIQVENAGPPVRGTVRIFLAPKYDGGGLPMLFREQKLQFIEMDRFSVDLLPGTNRFERPSVQSTVTVPIERTFINLNSSDPTNSDGFVYCGCGWPHHMLVPKGKPEGLAAELFVMVSDYAKDHVEQPPPSGCQQPEVYCGWRGRRYPDTRSMGFPFDRMPRPGVDTLQQFLTPNMRVQEVKIRFTEKILPPQSTPFRVD